MGDAFLIELKKPNTRLTWIIVIVSSGVVIAGMIFLLYFSGIPIAAVD